MPTLDSLSAGSTQTSPRVPSLPFRALLLPTRLTLIDLCLTSQQRSTSLPSKSFRPSSCSRTGRSSTRTSSCLSSSENTRPRSRVSCASFGVWLFVPFLLLSEMICSSDGSGGLTLEGSGLIDSTRTLRTSSSCTSTTRKRSWRSPTSKVNSPCWRAPRSTLG